MIKNNIISKNDSPLGGGIIVQKVFDPVPIPTIEDNDIIDNFASFYGGGIACNGSYPIIRNNIIKGNDAGNNGGGGIYCSSDSSLMMINNMIIQNSSSGAGGGIRCNSSFLRIINNTINRNRADTDGGIALSYGSSLVSLNTILWNNRPLEIYCLDHTNIISIAHSNVKGGLEGIVANGSVVNWLDGNINADPQFIVHDPYYHISDNSPCIGAGVLHHILGSAPPNDFEGDPRPNPTDSNPDIGADENPLAHPEP